jgi:pimeloyl-ACP methyl ester carboxylesterase
VNPGGPGASGIDLAKTLPLPKEITDVFDVVGFDPRGVGQSTPLVCHTKSDVETLIDLDPQPQTEEQWQDDEAAVRKFVDGCFQGGDQSLLPFIGTENVARDLDVIRAALGDAGLTYLGYSYGTEIGAVYADLFPSHVRALVLDGVVDPSLSADALTSDSALGFEGALHDFFAYCSQKNCAKGEDAQTAIDDLMAQARQAPISSGAGRPATAGTILSALDNALYNRQAWPLLGQALSEGLRGKASLIVRLADIFDDANLVDVNLAVNCTDQAYSRDPAHYEALGKQLTAIAPEEGTFSALDALPCAYWQTSAKPLKPPEGKGAPPILLIGTTGDPATPYEWAVAVSKELESAVLLTNLGEGHTAYLSGVACVDDAVDQYLLTLMTPEPGATCGDITTGPPIPTPSANPQGR